MVVQAEACEDEGNYREFAFGCSMTVVDISYL